MLLQGTWRHGKSAHFSDDVAPFTNDVPARIPLANATSYGLSSAVVTRDLDRGAAFARRLQAGMTHVNDSPVNDLPNYPFGGEKNSGLGRYNGQWSMEEFTTVQWISVQHVLIPYPF
jgi:acyl-CoA reductase-like NAD-dependent aldehyde dehydrogenase